MKKFGINHFEGILFLDEAPLKEYLRYFNLKEIYQNYDLLTLEKRIFREGPEFIFLDSKAYLIEFEGLTLVFKKGKKISLPKAEFYLDIYWDSRKRDSAYFFFPKENYILVINEKERRRDFLTLILFPFIPYYIERGENFKLYYDRVF